MADPTIVRGTDHFYTTLYEGNGRSNSVGRFVPFTDTGSITKSLMFDDGSNSYLSRTHSASNKKTFTISVWVKRSIFSQYQRIFNAVDSGDNEHLIFRDTNQLHFYSGDASADVKTNLEFENVTRWYHIVCRVDTTQSTASDRVRLYVDGTLQTNLATSTYPSQDADTAFNGNVVHEIGRSNSSSQYFDGYMAEFNFTDGQSYGPDTFGMTDTSTGLWVPKSLSSITYGTNGFRLQFANSAGQTIGDDTSGNTNDWAISGIGTDHVVNDSPSKNYPNYDTTQTVDGAGGVVVISEGSTRVDMDFGSSGNQYGMAIMHPSWAVSTGKYYWEHKLISESHPGGGIDNLSIPGIIDITRDPLLTSYIGHLSGITTFGYYTLSGYILCNGSNYSSTNYGVGGSKTRPAIGEVMNMALDMDNGAWYIGVEGTYMTGEDGQVGDPTSGSARTGAIVKWDPKDTRKYVYGTSTLSGYNAVDEVNFGQESLNNSIPTGYTEWNSDTVPEARDLNPRSKPDLVWIKNRDATDNHQWYDSTRGVTKMMASNTTDQEATDNDGLQKFLKEGFQVDGDDKVNTNNESYVAWNWVANGGTEVANTDGSGATLASTIQANQTAGFSIVQVTAPSSPSGTYKIAHGLGAAPEMIIGKNRENSGGYNWSVFFGGRAGVVADRSQSADHYLELNTTDAYADNATVWGDTLPTSSVFTAGVGVPLLSNEKTIFYCWTSIPGYSMIGRYKGNGNVDGPFVYTGFKPQWLMYKGSDAAAQWDILDNARNQNNPGTTVLSANLTNADRTPGSYTSIDFHANGFKIRANNDGINYLNRFYQFLAIAEHPLVGDGTNPATAR